MVPPLSDHEYRFDASGNIVSRRDVRQGYSYGGPDDDYRHDGLHRLTEDRRGKLTGSPPEFVSTMQESQRWLLDTLGNRWIFERDLNGNNSYVDAVEEQSRVYNLANEIEQHALRGYLLVVGRRPHRPAAVTYLSGEGF